MADDTANLTPGPSVSLTDLQRHLQQHPTDHGAWQAAAMLLERDGRLSEAINAMCRVLVLQPGDAKGHNDLGRLLLLVTRNHEAEASFRRALILDPNFRLAQLNLGQALLQLGRHAEARQVLQTAVAAQPGDHVGHALLGLVLSKIGLSDEALPHCRKAVDLGSETAFNWEVLAGVLEEIGETSEAAVAFERTRQLRPSVSIDLHQALMLPIIPASTGEIAVWRQRLLKELDRLQCAGTAITDPIREVRTTLFFAAYHGENDRPMQERLAAFYLASCPQLGWVAPHCRSDATRRVDGKIRLGIISSFFHHHIISILFRGLIARIDRDRFDVVVCYIGSPDTLNAGLRQDADHLIYLEGGLVELQQQVAALALDLILYPDIGMAPSTYFLAFARLAPIQCVQAGHPVTTGIPQLDYFLSARDLEPDDGDQHYSERLIRFHNLPYYYPKPRFAQDPDILQRLGVPAATHRYACPQTIFKLHPDFDGALVDILRRDPAGLVILIEGKHPNWTRLLRRRLQAAGPDVVDRIHFVPQLPFDDFMSLIAACDVLLDPFHFGGGTTSLAAFSIGAPTVTLPGIMTRGRSTLALYTVMGLSDLIARDPHDYVAKALRLANEPNWRESQRQAILANNHRLYATEEALREMEEFFVKAVEAAHSGATLAWP